MEGTNKAHGIVQRARWFENFTPEMSRQRDAVHKHNVQRAKKVVSDNQGLVDFAIGLVNSAIKGTGSR